MNRGSHEYVYVNTMEACTHEYLRPTVARFLMTLPDKARVLDLGCGNGSLAAALARPGWEIHGTDTSESGIKLARQAYPNITFSCLDAQEDTLMSHYGSQSFDAIVCTEVIEHVFAPRELAKNVFRLLRPGGMFVVSTPYHGYVKNLALAATGKMESHFTVLWDGGHIKFWSRNTLSALLHEAGFQDLEFCGVGRIPYVWKSMVMKAVCPK